jgi:hypothetical protein
MIRFLIILAILILALSFFGISIRSIVQSPVGHDNFTFIWQLIRTGWHILVSWFHVLVAAIQTVLPG